MTTSEALDRAIDRLNRVAGIPEDTNYADRYHLEGQMGRGKRVSMGGRTMTNWATKADTLKAVEGMITVATQLRRRVGLQAMLPHQRMEIERATTF